jgi:hypothetical protein
MNIPDVRLQCSDEQAVQSLAPLLPLNSINPDARTAMNERPLGKARNIYDGGGRYVSILGGNGLFHHPADVWPELTDQHRGLALLCGSQLSTMAG